MTKFDEKKLQNEVAALVLPISNPQDRANAIYAVTRGLYEGLLNRGIGTTDPSADTKEREIVGRLADSAAAARDDLMGSKCTGFFN